MHDVRPIDCERTRQWVSVALDCELSQFERALVAAHTARCSSCRTFEARVTAYTGAIRAAPPARLRSLIGVPSRRRPLWAPARIARLGSAAAATAAVIFLGLVSAPERSSSLSGDEHVLVAASLARPTGTNDLVVEMRLQTLLRGTSQAIAYGTGGIGVYKPPLSPSA